MYGLTMSRSSEGWRKVIVARTLPFGISAALQMMEVAPVQLVASYAGMISSSRSPRDCRNWLLPWRSLPTVAMLI